MITDNEARKKLQSIIEGTGVDSVWWVDEESLRISDTPNPSRTFTALPDLSYYVFFSNREEAQQYVDRHKPKSVLTLMVSNRTKPPIKVGIKEYIAASMVFRTLSSITVRKIWLLSLWCFMKLNLYAFKGGFVIVVIAATGKSVVYIMNYLSFDPSLSWGSIAFANVTTLSFYGGYHLTKEYLSKRTN